MNDEGKWEKGKERTTGNTGDTGKKILTTEDTEGHRGKKAKGERRK